MTAGILMPGGRAVNASEQPAQGITQHAKGCVISLTVSPRSSANRIEIDPSGTIRIKLTAPPVDGAANTSLLKYLSTVLGVPRSNLTILTGAQARHKRILAEGMHGDVAWRALSLAASRQKR
jgi:uncharacterized protein (TIGR00251 family)